MEYASPENTDFQEMGFEDLAKLVLRKDQFSMRPQAMRVLADRAKGHTEHLSVLSEALRDLEPSTRRRAAQTIGLSGKPARTLLNELCELLRSDPIWTVREAAAHAIRTLCWPASDDDTTDEIPLIFVESALSDREPLVRSACRQGLEFCLRDEKVPESIKRAIAQNLEEGLQHPHASRRCRAVSALCGLAKQNPAMIDGIAKGLRDSHWKVRRTTVQELGNQPDLVLSPVGRGHLFAEVLKRKFDQHRIVQTAAGEALNQLQAVATEEIRPILERVQSCFTAVKTVEELIEGGELSADVEKELLKLCRRRIDWHLREMPSARPVSLEDSATVETVFQCTLDLAGQWMASPKQLALHPDTARAQVQEKEAAWLLARLIELIASAKHPANHQGRLEQ